MVEATMYNMIRYLLIGVDLSSLINLKDDLGVVPMLVAVVDPDPHLSTKAAWTSKYCLGEV